MNDSVVVDDFSVQSHECQLHREEVTGAQGPGGAAHGNHRSE
jgi:hypothetical protein